jgi:fluoride exporter
MLPPRRLLLAVFAGGCAGALARFALSEWLPADPGRFSWATLTANVLGAFVLGLVVTRAQEHTPHPDWSHPLVGTGFCGALTTFSTMQLELLELLDAGRLSVALLYAGASVAAGLVAIVLGTTLVRRWIEARPL